jgi:hypothetical protein
MTLEIQVLDWDRHKKCDGVKPVNGIPTPLIQLGKSKRWVGEFVLKFKIVVSKSDSSINFCSISKFFRFWLLKEKLEDVKWLSEAIYLGTDNTMIQDNRQ